LKRIKMLSGRLAWVTGAGGGIGRQVCRLLAQEGANVVVDDIDETRSIETLRVIISVSLNTHESISIQYLKIFY
jgi:NAD(P)-dependent dehydrogenase (short-subunit alcohol dehydrogenase family)